MGPRDEGLEGVEADLEGLVVGGVGVGPDGGPGLPAPLITSNCRTSRDATIAFFNVSFFEASKIKILHLNH